MLRRFLTVLLVVLAMMLVSTNGFAASSGRFIQVAVAQDSSDGSIVETLTAAGDYTTLLAALSAAELTAALEAEGPFTLFAPTDAAFESLDDAVLSLLLDNPATLLRPILLYHVVSGAYSASDLAAIDSLDTVQGGPIQLEYLGDPGIEINGSARAEDKVDISASNGVIHAINNVLVPADLQEKIDEMLAEPTPTPTPVHAATPALLPMTGASSSELSTSTSNGLLGVTGGILILLFSSLSIWIWRRSVNQAE